MTRRGYSLLELLIMVAILGLLVGLVLAAVQKVRAQAVRTQSMNNLRQIIIATHQLSSTRSELVTGLTKTTLPKKPLYTESSIFYELLPWTYGERSPLPPGDNDSEHILDYMLPKVAVYISPADPSLNHPATVDARGKCSYSCNMLAFDGALSFPLAIKDGTSNTIAYSERYYFCGRTQENTSYQYIFPARPGIPVGGERRATFADSGWHDVMPVVDQATGRTVASVRRTTFQLRPRYEEADSKQLQTPHSGGLPVALFDGSVRTLSPSIAEDVFWAIVTPDGGEVVGDF